MGCSQCEGGIALMNGPGPVFYTMRGASTARRWGCCPECAQGVVRVHGGELSPARAMYAAPGGGSTGATGATGATGGAARTGSSGSSSGLRGPTGAEVAAVIGQITPNVQAGFATAQEQIRQDSARAQAEARARAETEIARLQAARDVELARMGQFQQPQFQPQPFLSGMGTRTDAGGMGGIPLGPILAVGALAALAYFATSKGGRR